MFNLDKLDMVWTEEKGSKTANEYYLKVTFFEKDLTQDVRDACGPSADSQTVRKWSQWKGGWREAIPQWRL